MAAEYGSCHCLCSLFVAGATLGYTDESNRTCLHLAILFGQVGIKTVRKMLEKVKQDRIEGVLDVVDTDKNTALGLSIYRGDVEIIKALIDAGADVNFAGDISGSPLSRAAREGFTDCVKVLLEAGANPVGAEYSYKPLMNAAIGGHVDCLEMLLDAGADPNEIGYQGYTPLMFAALGHKGAVVKFLLESGARVNMQKQNGINALMVAAGAGDTDIVRYLTNAGADINHVDSFQRDTAVLWAIKGRHVECLKLLLQYEPIVDNHDANQSTPLICNINHFAHDQMLRPEVHMMTKLLIRFGCDVNQCGTLNDVIHTVEEKEYPLEIALRSCGVSMAQLLWDAGSIRGKAANWCVKTVPFYTDHIRNDENGKLMDIFLTKYVHQPRSLLVSCRSTIRRTLLWNTENKIQTLPLPKNIKLFLNIPELDS